MTTQLSHYFTLEEMIASDYARVHGIDNTPPEDVLYNLKHKTCFTLDYIREMLGCPIHINSGYRCPAVNAGVGGSPTSAHTRGLAADIVVPGMSLMDVYKSIRDSQIAYDQLIFENTWLHIGLDATMRRENLVMYRENGKTLYKPGP
jgi:hypothetical protein